MAQQDIAPTDAGDTSLTKIEANFTELYGNVEDLQDGTQLHALTAKTTPADADEIGLIDSVTETLMKLTWANLKATLLTWLKLGTTIIPQNSPRGFLINGKIVVTDTGSGISVAIKGLDGNDPSATNPVYCRIGDTEREITSALSRTLADGTNWFNAGSAELATKEIDYFVYLIWDSNSSAVGLGFARIPYGNLVSDFSATTTNEKHLAGYADFTTTDEVEVIGRFGATLSAGAGYTWSVPTYTAKNLIQRPIFETRWLSWLPTYSGSATMTFTTVTTAVANYKVVGELVFISLRASGTTGGVAAQSIQVTAPFLPALAGATAPITGVAVTDTALSAGILIFANDTPLQFRKYDNSNFGIGAGRAVYASDSYQI